jgi:elongation factor G
MIEKIRNMGFAAHIDAGKTTVTERILFFTEIIHKMGEVDDGEATMDWMEEEKRRGITITSAVTTCFWKSSKINIIDTPGHIDFTGEVEKTLRILDGVVTVFCGVEGVQPQSETVWHQANKYSLPKIAFVNKMDRPNANFSRTVKMINETLAENALPIQLPLKKGEELIGVVDILKMKAIIWEKETLGKSYYFCSVPSEVEKEAKTLRETLIERLANSSERIMEKYIEGQEPTEEELKAVLRKLVIQDELVPILCGAALRNIGIQPLLDAIVDFFPSPRDIPPLKGVTKHGEEVQIEATSKGNFLALAFKTASDPFTGKITYLRVYSGTRRRGETVFNATQGVTERLAKLIRMHANEKKLELEEITCGDIIAAVGLHRTKTGDTLCGEKAQPILLKTLVFPEPVVSVAVEPFSKNDEKKISEVLKIVAEEDPTIKVKIDEETNQHLISGMGELHLEILTERIQRDYKIKLRVGKPRVIYKESIEKELESEYELKRQVGEKGQYAYVRLKLSPYPKGKFKFSTEPSVQLPKEFIEAVERGIKNSLGNGVLLGSEIINLAVTLISGRYHPVDSSGVAFEIAAALAFQNGLKQGEVVLLEPIEKIQVRVPEAFLGNVLNDFNGRRGKVVNIKSKDKENRIIEGEIPLSEMFGYITTLRSLTQGRGNYNMEFSHYQIVPKRLKEKIVERGFVTSWKW